jgi:hypothetical protein
MKSEDFWEPPEANGTFSCVACLRGFRHGLVVVTNVHL